MVVLSIYHLGVVGQLCAARSAAEASEICFAVHFVLVDLDVILGIVFVQLVSEVARTTHDHILEVDFEFPLLVRVDRESLGEVFLKNGPTNSFHGGSSGSVLCINLRGNIHQLSHFKNMFLYCFIGDTILTHPTAFRLKFKGHGHVLRITQSVVQASFSCSSELLEVAESYGFSFD